MFPPTWFAAWMNHRRAKIGLRKSGIAEVPVMSRGYGYRRGSRSPQELTEAEPGPPASRSKTHSTSNRSSGQICGMSDGWPISMTASDVLPIQRADQYEDR